MAFEEPRLVAITGGPGSGKTTLIAELAARGQATEPEAGRTIILDSWPSTDPRTRTAIPPSSRN